MARFAALTVVLLVACGGGDDSAGAHEVVSCQATWAGQTASTRCEQACAAGPLCQPGDNDCGLTLPACGQPGSSIGCPYAQVVEFDGQFGCCTQESTPDGPVFEFTACE